MIRQIPALDFIEVKTFPSTNQIVWKVYKGEELELFENRISHEQCCTLHSCSRIEPISQVNYLDVFFFFFFFFFYFKGPLPLCRIQIALYVSSRKKTV